MNVAGNALWKASVILQARRVWQTLAANADLGLAGNLTCREAEEVAELGRILGDDAGADAFIAIHAIADDEETDQHYELGEWMRQS